MAAAIIPTGVAPDKVEEASQESFPASDPPSWTPVIGSARRATPGSEAVARSTEMPRFNSLPESYHAENETLLAAIQRLERALAAPGREEHWQARVLAHLSAVTEQLSRHVASTESPDGILAEIDDSRPTLVRRREHLRHEHSDLFEKAATLQIHVQSTTLDEVPDFVDIRQRAAALLNALRHHLGVEADLLFESLETDIGVCD